MEWKRVILESPFSGAVERNKVYAKMAMLDCLRRRESPYASHLLLTQVLDDTNPQERQWGIEAGFAWRMAAEFTVFYCDWGFSAGMTEAYKFVRKHGLEYDLRAFWVQKDKIVVPETKIVVPEI